MRNQIVSVQGKEIQIITRENKDFVSLTDIAKFKNSFSPADIVKNWMRSRSTIEFLGLWEKINNPDFKLVEFDQFKSDAGTNYFVLSPQRWIEKTNAIGLISRSGKDGGTYAHKDIAFEFASWISSEFKLYLILEFQRLKDYENEQLKLNWNLQRTISKINYHIHTDAIKQNLVPPAVSKKQEQYIYANEADVLNVALFGMTAKEWRVMNPDKDGNVRDYASLEQLVVLSNLESLNSVLIQKGVSQQERLKQLNQIAIQQMTTLLRNTSIKTLR